MIVDAPINRHLAKSLTKLFSHKAEFIFVAVRFKIKFQALARLILTPTFARRLRTMPPVVMRASTDSMLPLLWFTGHDGPPPCTLFLRRSRKCRDNGKSKTASHQYIQANSSDNSYRPSLPSSKLVRALSACLATSPLSVGITLRISVPSSIATVIVRCFPRA